jgi:hypothetical protein
MIKPMPESSCEMGIMAKAAGVRTFVEMLTCIVRRSAFQKMRGMIQRSEYTNSLQVEQRAVKSFWT